MSFQKGEYGGQVIRKQGSQKHDRKSDGSIVPKKLGNAGGGKAIATSISLFLGTQELHTEVGKK
ncbi:hypothetical protein [Oceanobacillus locisalsi]|uniref:Uncharacterized protein n=1 Tax=Oceanobacillus locisalsi TaxID=546107 RepID=A0ABW3NDG6_9BACI